VFAIFVIISRMSYTKTPLWCTQPFCVLQ